MAQPNERGQAILEYLLIATVVVLALIVFKAKLDTSVTALYNAASEKITSAADDLKDM